MGGIEAGAFEIFAPTSLRNTEVVLFCFQSLGTWAGALGGLPGHMDVMENQLQDVSCTTY
jgi:hypothetical protein